MTHIQSEICKTIQVAIKDGNKMLSDAKKRNHLANELTTKCYLEGLKVALIIAKNCKE
ncbi:MAG: hypothetical protein IMZ53_00440 [Thermoplasmata archaeon]|nr:hypothetical protein [Thermoplasmata archaeon]